MLFNLILLSTILISKSNQNENTSSGGFSSCQSYYYHTSNNTNNNTSLIYKPVLYCNTANYLLTLGCCGNCTHRRCCASASDFYENLLDELKCDNNKPYLLNFINSNIYTEFEEQAHAYFDTIAFIFAVFVIIYLSLLITVLGLLVLCSIRFKKFNNLNFYQYLANRYYFIYKQFGINNNIKQFIVDVDEPVGDDCNNDQLMYSTQSENESDNDDLHFEQRIEKAKSTSKSTVSSTSTVQTGFEMGLLNKLYNINKFHKQNLESKREEKVKIVESLVEDDILVKFDNVDEKFKCKMFKEDNDLLTQQVLNLRQFMDNVNKKVGPL
jgi:hypothetical protein